MLQPTTLVLLLALVGAAPCKACTLWEHLTVKLFNEAAVEKGALRLAKGEAAWLLKSVCVVVDWVPCAVVSVSHPEQCAAPARAIELHILPSPLTDGFTETVMGFAFLMFRQMIYVSHIETIGSTQSNYALAPASRAAVFYMIGTTAIGAATINA